MCKTHRSNCYEVEILGNFGRDFMPVLKLFEGALSRLSLIISERGIVNIR